MTRPPAPTRPAMSFSDATRQAQASSEPVMPAGSAECFRLALASHGVALGWLGESSSEWALLVDDVRKALVLEHYPYNGTSYYRIKGSSRYMSVSNDAYVGFYNWLNATGFTLQGGHLVADHNQQKLSLHSTDDGYLYAWDAYTVLQVTLEPLVAPVVPDPPLTAQIEHVVVVMLENRSFDNMLGGLYPSLTRDGLYRGLRGDESNPVPGAPAATVFQGADDADTWICPYPDPGELFEDMNLQLFGQADPPPGATPTMKGFAANYASQPGAPREAGGPKVMPDARNVMQYYRPEVVPMTSYLAQQYAVCDGWFASGPVQTLANRMFAHCGTPGRVPGTNTSRVNNPDFVGDKPRPAAIPAGVGVGMGVAVGFEPPVTDKTVFQLLDETYPGQINWKVYYHDAPVSALCSYVYDHWKWASWDGGNVFRFSEHLKNETNFEYDIRHHRLPKYSFIEPRYTDFFRDGPVNSSHPGGAGIDFSDPNGSSLPPPISVRDGERLLKQVHGILAKYPETFAKTLLVVIYDEHGGLYDHVPPPPAVSPFEPPVDNFGYDRYGVRIPALLINPAIPPGTIYPPRNLAASTSFDHTSLIATLCAQFGLQGAPLTPRAGAAPVLSGLIPKAPGVHVRPAPPVIPAGDGAATPVSTRTAGAAAGPGGSPHALAAALAPLLGVSQRERLMSGP